MTKVLVYGGGKNTDRTAALFEQEMPLVVVKKTLEGDYSRMSTAQILDKMENDLFSRGERGELIVLADPLEGLVAGRELKKRYPRQKIVWYGQGIIRIMARMKTAYVLVSERIRRTEWYQKMKAACQRTSFSEHDGGGWKEMMKQKRIEKMELMEKVRSAQGAPIIVFHSEIPVGWVKEVVDWRNDVVDLEEMLLARVKAELGLKDWL